MTISRLSLSALVMLWLVSPVVAITVTQPAPTIEEVFSISSNGAGGISANRNNQIVAIYETGSGNGLYYGGPGLSGNFTTTGTRYLGRTAFSNSGVALYDNAQALAVAPIGQPPQEVYREPSGNISNPAINDQGEVAFYARVTNGTGLRDAYLRQADGTIVTLPDLGENSISDEAALIDGMGRVIARHQFTDPTFQVDVYRHTTGLGWENLTAGRLPAGVTVSNSVSIQGARPVSLEGDFVFQGLQQQPDGSRDPGVFLWDDDKQEISFIFDNASRFGNSSGAYSLTAYPTFSDHNDVWIEAYRGGALPEYRTQYRKGDGTILDVEAMLPEGYSPLLQSASMNYEGDLWLAARNPSTNLFSYFVLHNDRLNPIIEDTDLRIFRGTLTNSLDVYFWQQNQNGETAIMRLATGIPEPSSMITLMLAGTAMLWFRKTRNR